MTTKKAPVLHLQDFRLKNNAGMNFPVCAAGAELLDLDKGRWPTTASQNDATCKSCRVAFKKLYPWAVRST